MDGVLVDTEPEYIRTELRLARRYGIPLSRKEQRRYCGVNPGGDVAGGWCKNRRGG